MSRRRPLSFEDVAPGQELPPLTREITLTGMVMYAGATWDFHRYHYDGDFVRGLGFPAPLVDGQMVGALLAKHLMDWGGPDAFVRRLAYRQRAMLYPGDRVTIRGVVTGKTMEDGRALALCSLSVRKEDGTEVVSEASAAIELPARTTLSRSSAAGSSSG